MQVMLGYRFYHFLSLGAYHCDVILLLVMSSSHNSAFMSSLSPLPTSSFLHLSFVTS